ncbi:hypothetical protein SUGI_0272240 [Cryptomeria japonica]|nr:hypothetical protein SUGI_0272240 [Cryptomeria japonica]
MITMAVWWLLQHLQILLRIVWVAGITPIVIASILHRHVGALRRFILVAASRGKLMNNAKTRWSVPQSYFLHFYLVSVTWTTFLLVCMSYFAHCTTATTSSDSLRYSSVASYIAGGVDALSFAKPPYILAEYNKQAWKTVLVLLLIEAQVVRRLYETVYVFNYCHSARMHILGYLTGMVFYIAAPLSVCSLCYPEVFSYIISQSINSIFRKEAHIEDTEFTEFKVLEYGISLLKLGWRQWTGTIIFIWGSIHQHRCHNILGSLRTENQEESTDYFIPYGDWFEIVSCPHYLAEIVIYAGVLIATGGLDLTVWLLFGFVVANLTFAAVETHKWYLHKFDNYPPSRWSIIPFVC